MQFITFQTGSASARSGGILTVLIRLAVLIAVEIALLTVALVGFLVVLPLVIIGGIASYFYLRRRMRQAARQRPRDNIIDADYTIIDGP